MSPHDVLARKQNTDYAEKVVVGGNAAPNTPGDIYWRNFVESVDAKSQGSFSVETFLRGQLGAEDSVFRALRRGKVKIAGLSTSALSLAVPELSILRTPFLFDNNKELEFILNSDLKSSVAEMLAEKGLVMFDWQSAGWMNFYSTFPIINPSDVINKRLRVGAEAAAISFMRAIGADFAHIPFGDILPGLQTGLLSGGEQSTQLYITGGFYDYAEYYTISRHAYVLAIIVANSEWFEALSPEEQNIFRDSLPNDNWYRSMFVPRNQVKLEELKDEGLKVIELSNTQRMKWKNLVEQKSLQQIGTLNNRGQSLYKRIIKLKKAYAASNISPD